MFEHRTAPLGSFEKHILAKANTGHQLAFVPAYGCCILDVQIQGCAVLDGYQTGVDLDLNRWGKSGLLFPFPNRLAGGQYQWGGRFFNFPLNDPTTGSALHGFGMDKAFRILRIQAEQDMASVACQYEYDGQFSAYPFPFNLRIDFSLSTDGNFEMEYRAWNMGEAPMPWGFGWHPYFRTGGSVNQAQLRTPVLDMIGVDEQMIPTGKRYQFNEFQQRKTIGPTVLDNCFTQTKDSDTSLSIDLWSNLGHLHCWQETGEEGMNYVQLFTPPDRQSIAIEPMSCNVDAFNNQEGLIILQPGDMARGRFGFRFEPA